MGYSCLIAYGGLLNAKAICVEEYATHNLLLFL